MLALLDVGRGEKLRQMKVLGADITFNNKASDSERQRQSAVFCRKGVAMKRKMKAAVLKEYHQALELKEVPIPIPKNNEVLIRVKASALCVSDIHIQDGIIASVHPPYIPGHELAGYVEAVGNDVTGLHTGDRVIASIDITCGKCRFCLNGKTNLCQELLRIGFERNGSHAEYCVLPDSNVFKIGERIPFEQAACMLDAVGCMYNAVKHRGNVHAGAQVLILGTGGLGMNAIQIVKLFGAEVFATSRNSLKLQIASDLGADAVINTNNQSLYEEIVRITDGNMCDVVIDNIGIKGSVNDALRLVHPGGKVIVAGYNEANFEADYQEIMKYEKEILGVRGVMRGDIPDIIKLVENEKIVPYVYKTMPFEEINEALKEMREGLAYGRIVLYFK